MTHPLPGKTNALQTADFAKLISNGGLLPWRSLAVRKVPPPPAGTSL